MCLVYNDYFVVRRILCYDGQRSNTKVMSRTIVIVPLVLLAVASLLFTKGLQKPRAEKTVAPSTGTCVTDLFSQQPEEYEIWRKRYHTLHPELPPIYDAGSRCTLPDGTMLVSFSYFLTSDPKSGRQSIALFNKDGKALKENNNINCRTVGDLPAPRISKVNDDVAEIFCASADAGLALTQRFFFDLSRFQITEQVESSVQHDLVR